MYQEARLKKDIHDKSARDLAERGLKETAFDAVLNYRFAILVAEYEACGENPERSRKLLDQRPPATPDHDALEAERDFARALLDRCQKRISEASADLAAAEKLAEISKPELLAKIQYVRGSMAQARHDLRQEEQYYKDAARLAQKYPHPMGTAAFTSLGLLYYDLHRFSDAIEMYQKGLESARQWHDRGNEERALGNLGWTYWNLGDWSQSQEYSRPASEIARELGEDDNELNWLLTLGGAYAADPRELYDEAETAFRRGLELSKKLGDNYHLASYLEDLAQVSIRRGDIATAKDYVRQVETLNRSEVDVLYQLLLKQAEIALAEHNYPEAKRRSEQGLQLGRAVPLKEFQRFQTDLALAYAGLKDDRMADLWFRKSLKTVELACADVKEDAFKITCLGFDNYYSRYVGYLGERNRSREAIAVAELGRSRIIGDGAETITPEKAAANIQRVQAKLRDGKQVVLAYFLWEDKSYLWVVTHSTITPFIVPPIKTLYGDLYNYSQKIEALQGMDGAPVATRLYEELVRPAEKLIPTGAQVTIVPNRNLYHLNFETLVVPGPSPHYWIEDVELQVASSFSILASPPRSRTTSRQMLLIGDPRQAPGAPPRLAHAAEETQRVAAHFPANQVRVIASEQATPDSYRGQHPEQFRYIHFAAHGIADQRSPLDSYIALSPDTDGNSKLSARSIMNSKIQADLVTISSCKGGGTRTFATEGLIGLSWAFMHAGAHQVVAGLWDMDDASSPRLMDDFYAGINSGKTASQSLRDAKLKMLHSAGNSRLPYFWGTLQLYLGP